MFVVESMWTRFAAGAIGDVLALEGSFAATDRPDVDASLLDPARGSGALMRGGIYLRTCSGLAALLADDTVSIVANFTSSPAHYAVGRQVLEADKHLWSEKLFVTSMDEARELMALAEAHDLLDRCARRSPDADRRQPRDAAR